MQLSQIICVQHHSIVINYGAKSMNRLYPLIAFTLLTVGILLFHVSETSAQDLGGISGNFQLDAQTYKADSLIGALAVPEKVRSNGFLNLTYSKGNFSAGIRYEMYMKEILGFDPRWGGENGQSGITYRYAKYANEDYELTVGNFYEQFGNGLIFRSYEERGLGLDNAIDGAKVKLTPVPGLQITGLVGKQRTFFTTGPGIVRGGDIDLGLNELSTNFVKSLFPSSLQVRIGGRLLSKYQANDDPTYNLPENVMAWAARMSIIAGEFSLNAEYAHKCADPSAANGLNFNEGKALFVSTSFSTPGLGVNLSLKALDNMDFRSDRNAQLTNLTLNYLPAITKQYLYRVNTLYPYATQNNGEIGIQGDIFYTFEKGSLLGGQYGTTITLNYSRVHGLDTTHNLPFTHITGQDTTINNDMFYNSEFLKFGKRKYFEDIGIEISKQWTKHFKTNFGYMNQYFNKSVVQTPGYGVVKANIFVSEFIYSFGSNQALRLELQHLGAKHVDVDDEGNELTDSTGAAKVPQLDGNNGNWAYALLEYTLAPTWFFSVFDEYNYDNSDPDHRLHYLSGNVIWVKDALRISLGYGRVRGGILCVGGVCRPVPASNGFSISISSTF